MRGRPKIILATSYEEAVESSKNYRNNIIGSFLTSLPEGKKPIKTAGIQFVKLCGAQDEFSRYCFAIVRCGKINM